MKILGSHEFECPKLVGGGTISNWKSGQVVSVPDATTCPPYGPA